MVHRHILLVTFPAQGHIKPSLQFAKQLIKMGLEVTFATSRDAHRRMTKTTGPPPPGFNFAAFSDGYDGSFKPSDIDVKHMMSEIRNRGSQTLRDIIKASADEGRPITCLVYGLFLPWAAKVAREFDIAAALLWSQPATVLDIYHYYFHDYIDINVENCKDPSWSIELPGLPLLKIHDLPSFILPSNSGEFNALQSIQEQLEILDEETSPTVLVNSFDALEPEALKAIDKYNLIGIGPLIPSAFLDGKEPSDTSFGGDLFQKSNSYAEWISSKPKSSVVYVSFGSILSLPRKQMEEIARGLLESCRPFLWVIKVKENGEEEKEEDKLSCMEELEQQGMIVPWCSQLEVLSHPSLGCFVTHCGWNSTVESLVSGVPMVAFPQWTDQGTNAKMIEDVWKRGVRVKPNEEGTVEGGELKRCIEMVMGGGDRAEELRRNAEKWKDLARDAMKDGGSSAKNLKAFVLEIGETFH
ncbi:unnamed protein product [Ilex paraguariensis]|uniref:Glycosyltransferase n=1 Tax=Ilex paraguariensis TaxID=185542 RepID=A0ABC8RWR1_9AQUA